MLSVRIAPDDHRTLKELSEKTNRPMADLIRDAVADLKRRFMLDATNDAYRALQQDKSAWEAHLADLDAWDAASLADADLKDWK